jgi:hypothetical protein
MLYEQKTLETSEAQEGAGTGDGEPGAGVRARGMGTSLRVCH